MEKQKNGEAFTPRRLYMALSSDVIARCGFGLKVNSLHDPNNIFVQQVKSMATEDLEFNFMLTVSQMFHFLSRLSPFLPLEPLTYFNDLLKSAMRARNANNERSNDFVGVLNEMMKKLDTEEYKNLKITETTIMCQAMIFFLAGFETTASTLSYLTLNLAQTPQAQEKLVAEVDEYLARHDGKITHETIGELVYMQACIQETLRMYPPVIRIERVCNKDWYHQPTGLHIPKGMVVQVPIYAIHYNEEYYPDPYSFKPERFLPENKDKINPYAFLSFGMGNHNCIGMRFAKEEINLTMAHVLKHFTFQPNAGTKVKFMKGRTFIIAAEPFTVDAIKRQK
jgi:cytochrome P450